ncbi:isomerizing glutamine--fructose-6-phosphate transaminase [Chitinibacteraceae bacterium HSL-7]
MSHLFGLVSLTDASPAANLIGTRLMTEQLGHASWLAHAEDGLRHHSRELDTHAANFAGSGRAIVIRLDSHTPPRRVVALSQSGLGLVWRGALSNGPDVANLMRLEGGEPGALRGADLVLALIVHRAKQATTLIEALRSVARELQGVFALMLTDTRRPGEVFALAQHVPLMAARGRSALVIADQLATLTPVARQVLRLPPATIAHLHDDTLNVIHVDGERNAPTPDWVEPDTQSPDFYPHHMEKEIHEQAVVLADTLAPFDAMPTLSELFQTRIPDELSKVEHVLLLACGSSHRAALAAQYWFESLAGLPCRVEYASEFRYRDVAMSANTLAIAISQSGETADTVAALTHAQRSGASISMAISNQWHSTLVRSAALAYCTAAGPELGTASTKTFTAQLLALYLVATAFAQQRRQIQPSALNSAYSRLAKLPSSVVRVLALEGSLAQWAQRIAASRHVLVTARHQQYPIALEAAHKLAEVAYLNAEGQPGGEIKHGTIALVDSELATVAAMPWNRHAERLLANLQEIRARKGMLYVLTDAALTDSELFQTLQMPASLGDLDVLLYAIAFQLLAYRVALTRGTEVDAPRNLSKIFAEQ